MNFFAIFYNKKAMPEEDGTKIIDITPIKDQNSYYDEKPKRKKLKRWQKVIIYLTSVLLASVMISLIIISFANDVFAFVKDDFEVQLTLTENMSLKALSKELYRAGVINHPWVFRKYAEFRKKDNIKVKGGVYILSPNDNYDRIIAILNSNPKA